MATPTQQFDNEANPVGWFDPNVSPSGWFDDGLADVGVTASTSLPPQLLIQPQPAVRLATLLRF